MNKKEWDKFLDKKLGELVNSKEVQKIKKKWFASIIWF